MGTVARTAERGTSRDMASKVARGEMQYTLAAGQ